MIKYLTFTEQLKKCAAALEAARSQVEAEGKPVEKGISIAVQVDGKYYAIAGTGFVGEVDNQVPVMYVDESTPATASFEEFLPLVQEMSDEVALNGTVFFVGIQVGPDKELPDVLKDPNTTFHLLYPSEMIGNFLLDGGKVFVPTITLKEPTQEEVASSPNRLGIIFDEHATLAESQAYFKRADV